jgi:hypothetical protein
MKWKNARQSTNVSDQRSKNVKATRELLDIYPVASRDNGNGFRGQKAIPLNPEGQEAVQNKRVGVTGISRNDGSQVSDAVVAANSTPYRQDTDASIDARIRAGILNDRK